jgi:hypothetical protein
MPTYPVTVPAAAAKPAAAKPPVKRPFGDQPLDVQAGQSNVVPPKAAPAPASKRSAQQAALDLLAYVTPILAAKRGSELGVKGAPNAVVKAAQLDMGDVPADGIYGPRTRAKGADQQEFPRSSLTIFLEGGPTRWQPICSSSTRFQSSGSITNRCRAAASVRA